MVKQVNAVLLQGDHLTFLRSQGLAMLGYSRALHSVENVAGAFVARTAQALASQAEEFLETVVMTQAQGWTVVSDPSGFLAEDLEGWAALSAQLGSRVICVRHDDLGTELAVFDEGRARRIVSFELGEGVTYVGAPLAVEELWAEAKPEAEELLEAVACLSVDLQRVNASALYEVSQHRYFEGDRSIILPVFDEALEEVPDNVVNLLWAAS